MAVSDSVALARSVSSTGALGSLACALLSPDEVREAVRSLRQEMKRPFNLNFFCHTMDPPDAAAVQRWKNFLRPHYDRLGLDIEGVPESRLRLRATVLGSVGMSWKWAFSPDGGGALFTLGDFGIRRNEFLRSSAMFDEVAGLQFRHRLAQLILRVHDDGTIPRHRFFDRLA